MSRDFTTDLDKEADVVVICHLPEEERVEPPNPRVMIIFQVVEDALREALGVKPMELAPGKFPTFEFKICPGGDTCCGCKEEPFDEPCARRDNEQPFPRFGFSVGLDKDDRAFEEKDGVNHTFRYKHAEVLEVLKGVINDTDELAPEIWWDRGFGAFVYNLFFEETKS